MHRLTRTKLITSLLATCLAAALILGCGPEEELDSGPGQQIKSDKQRVVSPQVPQADFDKQTSGNHAFTWNLYQQLSGEDGNLFMSPHSISMALAMLHAGAKGNTEVELAKALHFDLAQAALHPVFNKLDQELESRGLGKQGADGGKFRLNVVNALWGQTGHKFAAPFLDTLALNYGAGLRVLDFGQQPDPSRKLINKWVEQQTENRIKDLLPEGSVDNLTKLVLTNAIYFNAAWAKPFKTKDTAKGSFTLKAGGAVTADMMYGMVKTNHAKGSGFEAVSLRYDGHELEMVLLVPDKGTLAAFEKSLSAATVDTMLGQLKQAIVHLKLPRFEYKSKFDLKATLKALGMVDAFTDKADLSGVDGTRDLQVTGVFHQAFVKVNEAGTEAAAATGVVAGATSAPPVVKLTVDRPFLFLIRDLKTRAVLFVGRVEDPTK